MTKTGDIVHGWRGLVTRHPEEVAMYEVRYDDGADHAGVGTFETYRAARRFADLVRSCGYEAVVKDMAYPPLLDEDFDEPHAGWVTDPMARYGLT